MTDFRMDKSKPIGKSNVSTIAGFTNMQKPPRVPEPLPTELVPSKALARPFEVVEPIPAEPLEGLDEAELLGRAVTQLEVPATLLDEPATEQCVMVGSNKEWKTDEVCDSGSTEAEDDGIVKQDIEVPMEEEAEKVDETVDEVEESNDEDATEAVDTEVEDDELVNEDEDDATEQSEESK